MAATFLELTRKLEAVNRLIDITSAKRMPLDRKLKRLARERAKVEDQLAKRQ